MRFGKCKLWLSRLGWFVLIWTSSVLALGIIVLLFRLMMNLAGLGA